ncbi:MAG: MFS transporter [Anaerolineaceae bacterium]|nr:MFS transporter [Anaerolineaceae bacterium]
MNTDQTISASASTAGGTLPKIPMTIAYYSAFISLGLTEAILGPSLPALASHAHASLSQISILFTAHSFGTLLGSYQSGHLYDRVRGHPLIAGALVTVGLLVTLVPVLPLLWLLALTLFLSGIFSAAIDVGCNALIIWVHRSKVSPFMNGLHFFFGVGAFLSPIIVAQSILLSGEIHWAYWFIAALSIPIAFLALRLPSPPSPQAAQTRTAGRLDIRRVATIMLFFFLIVGVEQSFGGWIYTYATSMKLSSVAGAAYLTSVFWGALMVGRLLSIPIAARFSPRSILFGDIIGALISISLILLFPLSQIALWIGAFGMGFSLASLFPTTFSLSETQMGISGKVTGFFLIGGNLGGMFTPWLIGQFFVPVGPMIAMLILLVGLLLSFLTLSVWLWDSSRRQLLVEG